MSDAGQLATEIETTFALSPSGRMLLENDPGGSRAPRMYLAVGRSGAVACFRSDLAQPLVEELEMLVADEVPMRDAEHSPVHVEDYVAALATGGAVEVGPVHLVYAFPSELAYWHDAPTVLSGTPAAAALLAGFEQHGLPRGLVEMGFGAIGEFWEPWCVALNDGGVASIAFAARLSGSGAAVGLATVPELRGLGFGAAAAATWASHPALVRHALFYGHSRLNESSRRVTERLGLRLIGVSQRFK